MNNPKKPIKSSHHSKFVSQFLKPIAEARENSTTPDNQIESTSPNSTPPPLPDEPGSINQNPTRASRRM